MREAAEERIGLPLRAGVGVGDGRQELAQDFFVGCGGGFIDGLREVVGRRVIADGEPFLEDGLSGDPGSNPRSSFTLGTPWRIKLY
jgi:hypothetical protein